MRNKSLRLEIIAHGAARSIKLTIFDLETKDITAMERWTAF